MSRKLGDLTLRDLAEICNSNSGCSSGNKSCPFLNLDPDACMNWWRLIDNKVLDVEVPVRWSNEP